MAISTKTFTDLVRGQVAAIQGAAAGLVDFTIGSVLRAIVEAFAQVVLWLQGLILALLAATRAATSVGADLDSWMADFGLFRLPASYASGVVTFGRFTATSPGFIPVGSEVQTADGAVRLAVVADTSNPAYSVSQAGYVVAPGLSTFDAPVAAVLPGAGSNAAAGVVNTIVDAITGIDTVTNAAAMEGGADAESDAVLRARFIDYLASLSRATRAAVSYAVESIQPGVSHELVENETYGGVEKLGYFYVVVDDGSGDPPTTFLNAVSRAVDLVRPLTSTFGVFPPVLVEAHISMAITVAPGYVGSTVVAEVEAAVALYVNMLGLGVDLSFTRLSQLAYGASPGVTNVTAVQLNGGTADLTASAKQAIRTSDVVVALA